MKRILLTIVIGVLACTVASTPTYAADNVSLGVYPPLSHINTPAGRTVSVPLVIENFAAQPVSLSISFQEFTASSSENGQVAYGENTPDFNTLRKRMTLYEGTDALRTLELTGKQKKELLLTVVIPPNEPVKDYYFSVWFINELSPDLGTDDLNSNSSITTIKGGIATNILLSIGKREKPTIAVTDFSTAQFFEKGPVPFNVRITNKGKQLQQVSGEIQIHNMFGMLIGKIPLEKSYILAGTSRRFSGSKQNEQPGSILWSEDFLLGMYTATVILNSSDDIPSIQQSLRFYSFPTILFIKLFITTSVVIFIIKRVRRRLQG